jgi:hypothetical protein
MKDVSKVLTQKNHKKTRRIIMARKIIVDFGKSLKEITDSFDITEIVSPGFLVTDNHCSQLTAPEAVTVETIHAPKNGMKREEFLEWLRSTNRRLATMEEFLTFVGESLKESKKEDVSGLMCLHLKDEDLTTITALFPCCWENDKNASGININTQHSQELFWNKDTWSVLVTKC